MTIRFDHPEYLLLLLLILPGVWLGLRSLATLEPARRWTAIALRVLVLLIVCLMLAGTQAVRHHSDLTVVAVIDESESVRRFAPANLGQPNPTTPPLNNTNNTNNTNNKPGPSGPDSPATSATPATPATPRSIAQQVRQWLERAASDRRPDDRVGLVSFDGRPTVRSLPSSATDLADSAAVEPRDGTDLASALRLAMALFPADSARRLVLVSDGNDTTTADALGAVGSAVNRSGTSDLLAAAREARAANIPIDVLPIDYALTHEVMVEGVYAPAEAQKGQTISLRVVLTATTPTDGLLRIRHDGEIVALGRTADGQPATALPIRTSEWTPQTAPGVTASAVTVSAPAPTPAPPPQRYILVRMIELPMSDRGVHRFEASFEPLDPRADAMAVNNKAQSFTLVHGQGKVLIVDHVGGEPGGILARALASRGIEVQIVPSTALPANLLALQPYDAVILQNVPAEMATTAQQQMLARYVNDLGGGLIMIGGPDSFGAGGWTNTPIDRVLPVECQIPSQTILPSGALVIVMDRSGSMSSGVAGTNLSQQQVANEAACLALQTLYPQDMIGVVAFDTATTWVVPLRVNVNPQASADDIRSINPGGGTDIYPGLVEAYQALAPVTPEQAAVKHVVLLTDGQSADGEWYKIVGRMRQANITLSTVGVGDGVNSQLLGQLAQMGGGQYYPVSNPAKLPQVFIKEARTIRKNLVKEKPFQPKLVNTGSPIMAGITGTPALRGLVLTGPKNDPRVYMPMLGPEDEPLFAHWQVGLGRSAAFTSDATSRWAVDWLGWQGYGDFWSRTVRAIERPSAGRSFDLASTIRDGRLHLRLDATAAGSIGSTSGSASVDSEQFVNFMEVAGSVLTPSGDAVNVKLEQTAPGVYEATLPASESGNYIVTLGARSPTGSDAASSDLQNASSERIQFIFGGVSQPPGSELRRFTSNRRVLEQIAEITGGRVLDRVPPVQAGLFSRELEFVLPAAPRDLWRDLLVLLLILFLIDVACRRIAWDLLAMIAWARQRAHATAAILRSKPADAQATLGQLKRRAAQIKIPTPVPTPGGAAPLKPGPSGPDRTPVTDPTENRKSISNKKFEADPESIRSAARSDADFSQTIGAASTDSASEPLKVHVKKGPVTDTPATTSRLLDAKRRAQQRHQD